MTIKKKIFHVILFCFLVICAGCGDAKKNREKESEEPVVATEEEKEDQRRMEPDKPEEKEQTYHFVDVYGNPYDAPLLDQLRPCPYQYQNLEWIDSKPVFKDESGNVISSWGIDISKYQGTVDYQSLKEQGIEFVILRVGFRGYGDSGTLVLDERFHENAAGAIQAGLEVGVYFFSQAISEEEAVQEAEFVTEALQSYEQIKLVVFDTEEIKDDVARTDQLTAEQYTNHCIAFCEAIKEKGYRPMIYANMKWMAFTLDLTRLEDYEKWYADYEKVPQTPYDFTIWQYTETGTIAGVETNVDLNLWMEKKTEIVQ